MGISQPSEGSSSGWRRPLVLAGALGLAVIAVEHQRERQMRNTVVIESDELDLPADTIMKYSVECCDGVTRAELEALGITFSRIGVHGKDKDILMFVPCTHNPRMRICRTSHGYKIVATSEGSSSMDGWTDQTYTVTSELDEKGAPRLQPDGETSTTETRTNSIIQQANTARSAAKKLIEK